MKNPTLTPEERLKNIEAAKAAIGDLDEAALEALYFEPPFPSSEEEGLSPFINARL